MSARNSEPGSQNPERRGGARRAEVGNLLRRVAGLHLFRGVLEDDVGRAFLGLLSGLAEGKIEAAGIVGSYARLFSLLAWEGESPSVPTVGDPWQNHLLDRLLVDENPFSRRAERGPLDSMGPSLLEAARSDLETLHRLFLLDGASVLAMVRDLLGGEADGLVPWGGLQPASTQPGASDANVPSIKARLAASSHWPSLLEELARHYAEAGAGDFALFRAFRWVRRDGVGRLEGVSHPDPISLEELVEYDLERALLLQNTEQFVAGFPANNVLLYGDRGTGKSSTVKALLNRYGHRGLRLVEVPKALLGDFPRILAALRGRRERFVLFVDDLSFDERETTYKDLKAALEGSLEARPENVVVYATSNRRHLVQERFADRLEGDGEIRREDTHQEKLSLADRFGITLIFSTPDQGRYLRIVESLARARGLPIDPADLRSQALRWAAHEGGFSGRTARQFVDHLEGQIGLDSLRGGAACRPESGRAADARSVHRA